MISTSALDTYVEKHSRRFVDELKELCAFPSISNHGRDAIQPARDWLGSRLSRFTDRVETIEAGGMPALYADGSVRPYSYSASATANGVALTGGQVWQVLWAFNDGLALSGTNQ